MACAASRLVAAAVAALMLLLRRTWATPLHLPPLPAVASPVVNGIDLADPGWGSAQPLVAMGLLDVTKHPFSADPTGARDATDAIQKAVDIGRARYLTVYFPAGTYRITRTIGVLQPEKMFYTTVGEPNCNNMREIYGAPVFQALHCGRTAPVVMQGARNGPSRPEFFVPKDVGLSGPVVRLHNPISENINMNQEFVGIDIRIEEGNPDAVGIYARGAQGVTIQDVTIHAGSAAIGVQGSAGSGGSHINVTVIGGQVGMMLGQAQPSPTLTGVKLVGQSESALVYQAPGRQTLTVVGLQVEAPAGATGPTIVADAPLSIVDAHIEGRGLHSGVVAGRACSLYMQDVWIAGFATALTLPNGTNFSSGADYAHVVTVAAPSVEPQAGSALTPVYLDGIRSEGAAFEVETGVSPPSTSDLRSKHLWPDDFPTWETPGACNAKDYGAKGDFHTDDTVALQKMLSDPRCKVSVLPKGYYAVSSTVVMQSEASLVGVGLIYSNIVPHLSVVALGNDTAESWPLLRTGSGRKSIANIAGVSILNWRHINTTYPFHWQASDGVWRRSHINRVDLSPSAYAASYYNQPLAKIDGHGGGRFYNFYQENWDHQGPKYRHLLILGTDSPWTCYHCNLEHSQGEANLEIRGASAPVTIHGFKGEGNYVQIWVADSAEFTLSGYGGNASPFPWRCPYPPGYAAYEPSILRIERTLKVTVANVVLQNGGNETACNQFETGFMGKMYNLSVFSVLLEVDGNGNNKTVPPGDWPVLYARGLSARNGNVARADDARRDVLPISI